MLHYTILTDSHPKELEAKINQLVRDEGYKVKAFTTIKYPQEPEFVALLETKDYVEFEEEE